MELNKLDEIKLREKMTATSIAVSPLKFDKESELAIKIAALESRLEIVEKEKATMTEKAIACLDSVKAMLENTDGSMTHRQRNFYSRAIVKYIEKVRGSLKANLEQMPF